MSSPIVSVSRSQLRLLKRAIRGERLPVSRYRREHATVAALCRKGLWDAAVMTGHRSHVQIGEAFWRPTELGGKVAAAPNGVLRLHPGPEKPDRYETQPWMFDSFGAPPRSRGPRRERD